MFLLVLPSSRTDNRVFFVSYVAFEVPSNLVLKKFRPSRWIPFTMICWALFQTFSKYLALDYEAAC